jgi:acyl transferase domain-containing protein/thioesterase domain-containing protein
MKKTTTTASPAHDIRLPNQPRSGQRLAQPQRAARRIDDGAASATARLLEPEHQRASALALEEKPEARRVAVVGFSGRFPGAADTQAFWQLLRDGRSAIGEFPYWNLPGIAERRHLRDVFACPGGFIQDALSFDADFFSISAREAEAMDPQHRLVLEQTWAAFEDAGLCPQSLRGSNTGVFIGVSSADYSGLLARRAAGAHDATGNAHSIIANRISYLFDFHGPSAPVDTACSSSLVAVHRAAQAILKGDCVVAVAGGVNLCLEPMVFIGAAKAGMLSPAGRCKTFSADADGYVRGEGVGIVILKDYRHAIADGDNIVATLIGSAENHGGHANSLTAPNPSAQAELIKAAWRGIDIDSASYIEVHGTGTRLGDPIEIRGLRQAFAELGRRGQQRCCLGSVKTNIGHLESAAGIAGMIKTLLALRHGYLPASLHGEPANPYIDLAGSPFEVLSQGREWARPESGQDAMPLRRAGVSSFGFGGANAHIVLEEALPRSRTTAPGHLATIFPLSARTPEALRARAAQLVAFIERQPQLALPELAASLQLSREAMNYRLAIVAPSRDSLLAQLKRAMADGGEPEREPPQPGHGEPGREPPQPADDGQESDVQAALLDASQRDARQALLLAWRQGEAVDWRRFYRNDGHRQGNHSGHGDGADADHTPSACLPLPAYPFRREIYWIGEAAAPSPSPAVEAVLHPLVQRNTSDLAGQRFSSRFDGAEFFFDEHRINGVKVLPGVAYLEMARAAVELSLAGGESLACLKNVAWLQPMRHEGAELQVDIELTEQDDGAIQFEISNASGDGPAYCRGLACAGAAKSLPRLDLSAIAAATGQRLAPEQCYDILTGMGLGYGESFRAIRALQAGNGQVLAELALPRAAASAGAMPLRLPPGLLDSALQAALGLAWPDLAGLPGRAQPVVPFALDELMLGDLNLLGERCYAWVRHRANQRPGRISKLDVDLCDASGRVALRLLGFSSTTLDLDREAGAETETETGQVVLAPVWRERAPAESAQRKYRQQLILLAGHEHVAAAELLDSCRKPTPGGLPIEVERLPAVGDNPAVALERLASHLISVLKACRPDTLVQLVVPSETSEAQTHRGAGVPVYAALHALLKTARNEGLVAAAQSIEFAKAQTPMSLARRLMENAGTADERIRYADSPAGELRREVASWHGAALPVTGVVPWRAGGVYLLTGGTGGLGRLLGQTIAREAPGAKLILASRSAEAMAQASGQLTALKALGAEVWCEALDVADQEAVKALIVRCEAAWGGIHGIFHCAGLVHDSLLRNTSEADLNAVLAPKAAGTLNLDLASAHLPLDCFVLFSSVAAVIGNPGQGGYALANAFMDEFAGWRNRQTVAGHRHGRTLALNWPLWRNGGMRMDPERERQMTAQTGIVPLSDEAGLGLLRGALAASNAPAQWMVLEGDTARIQAFVAAQGHELAASRFDGDAPELGEAPIETTANAMDAPTRAATQALSAPASMARTLAEGMPPASGDALLERAIQHFKRLLSKALKRPAEKIESDSSFERYGADSIILAELTTQLEQDFGSLPATLLYEYQTVRELSQFFIGQHRDALRRLLPAASAKLPAMTANAVRDTPAARPSPSKRRRGIAPREAAAAAGQACELAIIGLSGRYPGADDLETFWRKLADGEDLITEVPPGRWNHERYFDEQRDRLDKTYCKWGGFLNGVEDFDPLFFNLSPREAAIINPNERLFLETCWNLLEGAGMTRQRLKQQYQQQVGVFVGAMYQQYQAFEADLVRESLVSVTSYSAIANRVSYFFDLRGPSLAIDTMCSSSISAIHAAGEALRNGDCKLAIAGGVNLTLHPKKYVGLSVGKVLGSHAASRSFGDGDGYLPAEGVGAVLLKTLADAKRDGDTIFAVIKSTALNHGGHTHGFSVPSAQAQAALIEGNFKRAGIDPRTVSYVESAANGSAMGDAIELSALNRVFTAAGVAKQSCAIGSVKSNLGHAEAASGMSQLSKLVLQLQYQQLAPSLMPGVPNPRLDWASSPFVLQRELAAWPQPEIEVDGAMQPCPRRATLSAFGAGGSNAHLILEEYPSPERERELGPAANDAARDTAGVAHIVPMSARSLASLRQGVARLAQHLATHPELRIDDIAHTLQTGREAMEWRLAVVVQSVAALRASLAEILPLLEQGDATAALEKLDPPVCFGNLDEVPAAIASLLSGPGADVFAQSLIASGEWQPLALLWTQGGDVPWPTLRPGARLVCLPTYAFDRKRYWLEQRHAPAVTEAHAATEGGVPEPLGKQGLRLLADLLEMQPEELLPARQLSAYGVDSIVMLQLAMQLQVRMDPALTLADIQPCVTVRDLLDLLARSGQSGQPEPERQQALDGESGGVMARSTRFLELQRLNQVNEGRPVFWFHGAVGGSEIYQGLARRIDRPFFGLQAKGWMTDRAPLEGIPAMAAYYVQAIQSVQPHGPYDLGGYSLGGMLAYEVTRQMQASGETVATLVMLDSPDVTGERTARLTNKTRWLQTVNMGLQMTISETPERFSEVLIHRDEIDSALSDDDYRQQLTALARQRGLKMSDERLSQTMEQGTRIQQAYQIERYLIPPLPKADDPACYYFRNASGLWMGALEPYFSTDSAEFAAFNHSNYWQAWQQQLPNFRMIEVASSSHMTLLSEPEVFDVIAKSCMSLYAGEGVEEAAD